MGTYTVESNTGWMDHQHNQWDRHIEGYDWQRDNQHLHHKDQGRDLDTFGWCKLDGLDIRYYWHIQAYNLVVCQGSQEGKSTMVSHHAVGIEHWVHKAMVHKGFVEYVEGVESPLKESERKVYFSDILPKKSFERKVLDLL